MATPPTASPIPPSTPTPAAPGPQVPSGPSPPASAAPPSTPSAPPSTPATPAPSSTPPPSSPPPSTPPAVPSTPPPTSPPPVTPAPPPSTPSPPPSTPSPPPPTLTPPPSTPPVVPVPAPPSGGTPPPEQPPPTPPPATPSSPVSTPPPKRSPPKQPPAGSPSTPATPPSTPATPPSTPATPPSPGETPPAVPPSNPTPTGQPAVPPSPSSTPSSPLPPSPANPSPANNPPAPPGTPSPAGPVNPSVPASNSGVPAGSGSNAGSKTGLGVGIGVAFVVVALLVGILVWFMRKKKRNPEGHEGGYVAYPGNFQSPPVSSQVTESPQPKSPTAPLIKTSSSSLGGAYSPSEGGLGHSRSWFTLEELTEITNGFSPQNILGEGGFGSVYKGILSDGREVAVKQLKVGGGQGEREFQAEVEIISRVHHRHLVSLVGYCISDNQRLLVYDYVPNNTLHYHLHGSGRPVLSWATRVKVAVGAARGIAYLHEDCHPRIIHRDIKSSNILLDNSFEARVSDFGLAKLTVDAETHVTTRVMGTFGYLAPEYASSGKLTDRSDVYSFGVVLLELITGRKPVDTTRPLGDESLVEWARPLMTHALETGNLENLPDVRLQGNYNEMEMFRMIEVAAACVRHSAPMRPRMGLVMRALDNLADGVDLHNGIKPGQSELFNTGANSEEIRIFQRMAFGGPDLSSDFSRGSWMSHSGPG